MENKFAFTPGPWAVREYSTGFSVEKVLDGLRSIVATCYDRAICDEHGGNALANARAIAALPDLVAALEVICNYMCHDDGEYSIQPDDMELARAALAKVRG